MRNGDIWQRIRGLNVSGKDSIFVVVTYLSNLTPCHSNDNMIPIMEVVQATQPSRETLQAINRIRCFGHLFFLSDITSADGSMILTIFTCQRFLPHTSNWQFPPEVPTQDDWVQWFDFWKDWDTGGTTALPLGTWTHPPHFVWKWFYDDHSDTILERVDSTTHIIWVRYNGRMRLGNGFAQSNLVLAATHTGLPASVDTHTHRNVTRTFLHNTGPPLALPSFSSTPKTL